MSDQLTVGDKAPEIDLAGILNSEFKLSQAAGKNVVLYFYPKDDTKGCTNEAIDFTTLLPKFTQANTLIVGVSKDTLAKHQKFIAKYDLGVELLSDPDGVTCEDYGVWVEKSMYGKKYMGIERATFLIDAEGKIKQIWRKVKVNGHAEAVLQEVLQLI